MLVWGDVFRGEVFLRRLQVEFPEGGRLAEGEGRVFLAGFQGFLAEGELQREGEKNRERLSLREEQARELWGRH